MFVLFETWLVPIEGWFVDKYGPSVVIFIGGVLCGIGWVMNSYATSLSAYYAAQIIAGILEFKKGNTFGMTAFISYGVFWLTLVAIWLLPEMSTGKGVKTEEAYMGWYLFMWGVFTFFMWLGTFNKNWVLQFVFLSLWILFFLLAIRDWAESPLIGTIAGYEGIVCGLSAIYLAMAEVLEESRGKKILPF